MKKPAKLNHSKSLSESTTDNRTYKIATRRFRPRKRICKKCNHMCGCNHPQNFK